MNISLRQIRAFVAVAQFGGFTAAAERLHLTQSALSVLVRGLEREFGTRLFDRTTRVVQLSDAGREFFPVAEKMLGDLFSAMANSKALAEKKRGLVVIAATPVISSLILPKAIARYGRTYPGIRFALKDGAPASQIQRMVQDNEVDIGIGPVAISEHSVFAEPFMIGTLVLACPRDHPLAGKARVSWSDLAGHPFIALSSDNAVQQMTNTYIALAGIDVDTTYEVFHMATAIGLVDAGLGISVLPSHARAIGRLYRIKFRKLGSPTIKREVHVMTHHTRPLSPAAESFKKFLLEFADELDLPKD